MIRRARLLLALLVLSTLSLAPAVFADDAAATDTSVIAQVVDYVVSLIEGDNPDGGEYSPVFLPGG